MIDPTFQVSAASGTSVGAIAVQPDGKIVVGGLFTTWGSDARNNLVRLQANGSLDPEFVPISGSRVMALGVFKTGQILVGRSGYPSGNVMVERLTETGQSDGTYDRVGVGRIGDSVYVIKPDGEGGFWVGGSFRVGGADSRSGVAHIDGTGEMDDAFASASSDRHVTALAALPNGKVMIGLSPTTGMGWDDATVVELDASGGEAPGAGFRLSTSGYLSHLGVNRSGQVILGGLFDRVDDQAINGVAILSREGELVGTFQPKLERLKQVLTVAEKANGNYLIVGYFERYGDEQVDGVVETTSTGEFVRAFTIPYDGSPTGDLALLPDGGMVVGYLTRNPLRWRVERFGADGTRDESYANGVGLTKGIRALVADEQGGVVVAGYFDSFGEVERSGLVRIAANGEVDLSFNPDDEYGAVYGEVIAIGDGTYLVAGDADLVKSPAQPDRILVRTTTDGRIDQNFTWDLTTAYGRIARIRLVDDQSVMAMEYGGGTGPSSEGFHLVGFNGGGEIDFETSAQLVGSRNAIGSDGQGGVLIGGGLFTLPETMQSGVVQLVPASRSSDFFQHARILEGAEGAVRADNSAATAEADELLMEEGGGRTLWFEWTAPTSGQVVFSVDHAVAGSRIRAAIGDAIDALQTIAAGETTVGFWVEAGQSIKLQVDSTIAEGALEMTWNLDGNPQLVTQPAGVTLRAGKDLELNVTARGSDLTYQWRKHGFALDGATDARLLIADASLRDAGFYDVVVSNGVGTVSSERVRVTVFPSSDPGGLEFDPAWSVNLEQNGGLFRAVAKTAAGGVVMAGQFTGIEGHDTKGLVRLNAAGEVDTTFQTDLEIDGSICLMKEVADGKVLLVGDFEAETVMGPRKYALRLNPDGSLDSSFVGPEPYRMSWEDCAVDEQGRIYGVGSYQDTQQDAVFTIFRLRADGSWDAGYHPQGLPTYTRDSASVTPDGRLVVGLTNYPFGAGADPNLAPAAVVRFLESGQLDASFTPDVSMFRSVSGVLVTGPGMVYVIGQPVETDTGFYSRWGRYDAGGARDETYQGDGNIGVVMRMVPGASEDVVALSRTWSVFRLGQTGELLAELVGYASLGVPVTDLTVTKGGQVVVVGGTDFQSQLRSGFIRMEGDFSNVAHTHWNMKAPGVAHDIRVAGDGGLIVGGKFDWVNTTPVANFVKLTAEAEVDETFATSGTVNGAVRLVREQADGKWLLAGDFSSVDGHLRNGLARLQAEGEVDAGFVPYSGWSELGDARKTMVLEPLTDGQVLVGGAIMGPAGPLQSAHLFRLNADGSLDASFDTTQNSGLQSVYVAKELRHGDFVLGGSPVDFQNGPPLVRIDHEGKRDARYSPPGVVLQGAVSGLALDENEESWVLQQLRLGKHTAAGLKVPGFTEHGVSGLINPSSGDLDLFAQADGRMIVAGHGQLGIGFLVKAENFFRLNANGSIDQGLRVEGLKQGPTAAVQRDDGMFYLGLPGRIMGTMPLQVAQVDQPTGPDQVVAGAEVTLRASYTGAGVTFQWYRDGMRVDGAIGSELTLKQVSAAQAGVYRVTVTNARGVVLSPGHYLGVREQASVAGFHQVSAITRTEGEIENYTISNEIYFTDTATLMSWALLVPAGWSVQSVDAGGALSVSVGEAGNLSEWIWDAPSASPVRFTYDLIPSALAWGRYELAALVEVQMGVENAQSTAKPDPLLFRRERRVIHAADMDGDARISLAELLRVIELYNTRSGSIRTGRYRELVESDDGFATDTFTAPEIPSVLNRYHSADTNRDGQVSLGELLGLIELYNVRQGTTRTGAYRWVPDTDASFEPDL